MLLEHSDRIQTENKKKKKINEERRVFCVLVLTPNRSKSMKRKIMTMADSISIRGISMFFFSLSLVFRELCFVANDHESLHREKKINKNMNISTLNAKNKQYSVFFYSLNCMFSVQIAWMRFMEKFQNLFTIIMISNDSWSMKLNEFDTVNKL